MAGCMVSFGLGSRSKVHAPPVSHGCVPPTGSGRIVRGKDGDLMMMFPKRRPQNVSRQRCQLRNNALTRACRPGPTRRACAADRTARGLALVVVEVVAPGGGRSRRLDREVERRLTAVDEVHKARAAIEPVEIA